MTPTIQTFTRALLTPDLAFGELADARAVTGPEGLPQLMRTTRFAEAEIEWQGRHWLLSLPLSSSAIHTVERVASRIGRLHTEWLTPYRILPGEMRWCTPTGAELRCDLVLQHLPEGLSFREALCRESTERLLSALDTLREALRGLDFAHGNLRDTNLRWAGGRFIPLRYHDARFGHPEIDDPAFEALRERILRESGPMVVSDVGKAYNPLLKLTGHRWVHPISEGLACVEDDSGWGYVDPENRVVIPSIFEWADSFHEGRAEVKTATGMGLIDRRGAWVIPPVYEIVDYDPVESNVYVCKGGLWAEFDYLGRQQSDFGEREART